GSSPLTFYRNRGLMDCLLQPRALSCACPHCFFLGARFFSPLANPNKAGSDSLISSSRKVLPGFQPDVQLPLALKPQDLRRVTLPERGILERIAKFHFQFAV